MNQRVLLIYFSIFFGSGYLSAQTVDTILTEGSPTHMFLNIEVPMGAFVIKSSQVCGISYSKVVSKDPAFQPELRNEYDTHGNLTRRISYNQQGSMQAKSFRMAPARINRFSQGLAAFRTSETALAETEFFSEPTVPTDLRLFLGSGDSKLDLSGLNLHNVVINSSFSDVVINYEKSNLSVMNRMDIHTGKADVYLDNIEFARADIVSIQTGMGNTRIVLNNNQTCQSAIYVSSAVGNCELVIHEEQPTQIILRNSYFAKVNVGEGDFKRINRSTLVNGAYLQLEDKREAVKVICNLDFGKLFIHDLQNRE